MDPGEHQPTSLTELLPSRAADWAELVRRHGLSADPAIEAFTGANSLVYADMVLRGGGDHLPVLNSTVKLRQAGFHGCMDTEDMFIKWFTRLQQTGVLPRP
jgi:hypothetical protein